MVALNVGGPTITPNTMQNQGGGAALPPYLQVRKPTTFAGTLSQVNKPVVTPKSTATPGEVASPQSQPKQAQAPAVTPAGQQPPQAGGQTLADVYNYFKSDLENQRKQAMAGSIADASARGVYYGTPLTGSEADIQTQYLRGLGQLQAGMYGNEQQNQLARLGLATQLFGSTPQPQTGGIDPSIYQMLGSLFGGSPTVSGQRSGPSMTPAAQLPKLQTPITLRGGVPQPVQPDNK